MELPRYIWEYLLNLLKLKCPTVQLVLAYLPLYTTKHVATVGKER